MSNMLRTRQKEDFSKIIHLYGNLIPEGKKIDNYQFCTLINERMSLCNPITKKWYTMLSKMIDNRFERLPDSVRVTEIR